MKKSIKKFLAGTLCVAAATAVVGGGTIIGSSKIAEKKSIGSEAAISAAFEDAGLNKENVLRTESNFERENGKYVFEVEFDADGKEYDYIIDAKNGKVIERKVEKDDNVKPEKTTAAEIKTQAEATESADNGLEKAKETALIDAGVDKNSVKFIKAKLDTDDGKAVYEIEFAANGKEYEYDINASTGKIIEKDTEALRTTAVTEKAAKEETTKSGTTKADSKQGIDVEKAKQIALADAGVNAADVKFVKAKADYDDGIKVFDVEFVSSSKEYEYEINASTGKIIDRESEPVKAHPKTEKQSTTAVNSGLIGIDSAKQKALSHAGLNGTDVKFVKVKLDKDNGIDVYEIEFVSGIYEYEYEINASNGKVVEWDKDIND